MPGKGGAMKRVVKQIEKDIEEPMNDLMRRLSLIERAIDATPNLPELMKIAFNLSCESDCSLLEEIEDMAIETIYDVYRKEKSHKLKQYYRESYDAVTKGQFGLLHQGIINKADEDVVRLIVDIKKARIYGDFIMDKLKDEKIS